jgi:DUF3072 family protein
MTDPSTPDRDPQAEATDPARTGAGNAEVPEPATWRTGDEPPTDRQAAYLETLAREAGEQLPEDLTKAQASEKIDELRDRTDRR